jgi:dipeptidyl aminopeptidase/acylaminoacyl peptidase
MQRFAFALGISLSVCVPAFSAEKSPPKGIAAFSRHDRFIDAKISPKGTYLAAINTEAGRRSLVIIDLAKRKSVVFSLAPPESVGNFFWANDERVMVQVLDESDGTLATPVSLGEIYAVNANGGRGELVFSYRAQRRRTGVVSYDDPQERAWGYVLSRFRNDNRHVLIATQLWDEQGDHTPTLFRMDAYTGSKAQIMRGPVPEVDFLTDENGEPRIALGDYYLRPRYFLRGDSGWQEFPTIKGMTPTSRPFNIAAQTHTIDLADGLEKGFGFFTLNMETGERKLVARNDWVPPSSVLTDGHNRVLAVEYEPDVPTYEFVAPEHPLARALNGLLAAYPDEQVRFISYTDDEKKVVAYVYSDKDPGRYLLLDVDKMSAEEIVARRPWVNPQETGETTAFHIRASDGMWIHGYVTLPAKKKEGPAPLVVLPHGGPHHVRDTWAYNPEAQLLASEGFAVLRVNYRGSGGYGPGYQEAGYQHWSDRIIDDIIDATRYAVRKGYGDPARTCIYGASFGGFAALQSAIRAPDLFRCAVGYAGVYDLSLMDKNVYTTLNTNYLKAVLGTDKEALKAGSPAYNASKVKAKVFLIHGKKDLRAPLEHAEKMKDALEAAGAKPEWLVETKEGHGFYDEAARESMYTRLVAFLHENTK